MPTISWAQPFHNCFLQMKAVVEADVEAGFSSDALVVYDGTNPDLPSWMLSPHVMVFATGQRSGPAAARNLAAREARGDVLIFVDADVELHPETLTRFRQAFCGDPELDAVFGSYDDAPAAPGVVSRFRNLLHHHTHHRHAGPASSFWAGCGAMRRHVFLALGGFDTAYRQPSIEDVELGLRLWRRGGRIVLDPTIQGCHHKSWTLASMVVTDIRQRAIPWSRLLLEQSGIPATLNLSLAGRVSGALALLVPIGLVLTLIPASRFLGVVSASMALLLVVGLNLSFHRLHLRRCGWAAAFTGVGLHVLHLCCASGTFMAMAGLFQFQRPLSWPLALKSRPNVRHGLVILALATLALLAFLAISKGLVLGWSNAKDLRERFQEWQVFRAGHFPMGGIYGGHPPPGMRSSPYPLWAIPLFGLLFHPWGLHQGILTIQVFSLLSLALIAWIGYRTMRPHGIVAGWCGALAPLAISGNANALAVAQFSIICMGLVFLEWQHLLQRQPRAAGLCWALAMIKPQIALLHGTPLAFQRGQKGGLWAGLLALALLSVVALLATGLSPLTYSKRFFLLMGKVQDDSGWNLTLQLSQGGWGLWLGVGASLLALLIVLGRRSVLRPWTTAALRRLGDPQRWMIQAGLCSLLGYLGFYHRSTDHIMLAPALLAMADLSWRERRMGVAVLSALLGVSLWTPARLILVSPVLPVLQGLAWFLSALVLAVAWFKPKAFNIAD
ncbi:MAG: hypothetical protein RLZZ117_2638 [Cyanobacteriota bacterium]